jgi:hypothetical protein
VFDCGIVYMLYINNSCDFKLHAKSCSLFFKCPVTFTIDSLLIDAIYFIICFVTFGHLLSPTKPEHCIVYNPCLIVINTAFPFDLLLCILPLIVICVSSYLLIS